MASSPVMTPVFGLAIETVESLRIGCQDLAAGVHRCWPVKQSPQGDGQGLAMRRRRNQIDLRVARGVGGVEQLGIWAHPWGLFQRRPAFITSHRNGQRSVLVPV